jgi:hypothetical protein
MWQLPGSFRQKIRAAQAGQSLHGYLCALIESEAAKPAMAQAVEQARREATADIGTADIPVAGNAGTGPGCNRMRSRR